MKVIAKYVTVEAVKDKQVLTLLFLDWNSAYKEGSASND